MTLFEDEGGGVREAEGPGGGRFLVPALIGVPVLLAWLWVRGEATGMLDTHIGLALFAGANVVCLAGLAMWATACLEKQRQREKRATDALRAQEEARLRDEDTLTMLERTAEIERLSRLTAEDALREKEDQLLQAQKLEAIGSLAGGVAHDFNNLLTVVLSYADILAADLTPDDPMWEGLEEIRKAGERGADLTRQLLAFSRKQVLTPTVLDLDQIIEKMLKMLRRLIGSAVELSHLQAHDLAEVHLDRSQTEQVLLNLVVNARDALPRGGKILLQTANVDIDAALAEQLGLHPGPHVVLTVKDNGTGMDAATKERIFEPFFTTKEKGKGTGLGLSVVFGIVKQSGGHIAVTTELGCGTTFSVYFPRAPRLPSSEPHRERPRSQHGGNETILLVEDEEHVRHLATTILRRNGYLVLDAATGGDALLLSEQYEGKIDLLITDIVMPRLAGDRLSERLVKQRPGMCVLFMSGCTDEALPTRIADTAPAFLAKPLTPDALLWKVRDVLAGVRRVPEHLAKVRRESGVWAERRRSRSYERRPTDT
ncbi:MAG: ATP-binding protein [Polyangiaceae bacterium]